MMAASDEEGAYRAIFQRKSVRKYLQSEIDDSTIAIVSDLLALIQPMVPEVRTEFKILTSDQVKGMFKVDAPRFVGLYSEGSECQAANAGFMIQQLDLLLSARGLGTCWQGGPKPVHQAAHLSPLEFVSMLAFGKPAEEANRKDVSEFHRRPLAQVSDALGNADILEAGRLAPSAMNNQAWHFSGSENEILVFAAKNLLLGRLNQISAGAAVCHLWLAARHSGRKPSLMRDRDAPSRSGFTYVVTLRLASN